MKDNKIDFVITWVDGNDLDWRKEKNKYDKNKKNDDKCDSRNIRYRDMECLKYWFRGVEKYAPWVNKIYFVTYGHIPEWLNIQNKKIVIVKHSDYMPKEYLPTFNSNAIEANIHKIKGLSEQFVYFNDDMFIIKKVKKSDFFKSGIPCDSMSLEPISMVSYNGFHKKICNDIEIINKYFSFRKSVKTNLFKYLSLKQGKNLFRTIPLLNYSTFLGFRNTHAPVSYLKATFEEVYNCEKEIINKTMSFKFRNNAESVNHWLYQYWQFAKGNFIQRNINFSKYYRITNPKIYKVIEKRKYKLICINDASVDFDFEAKKNAVIESFEKILPNKCSFEK